MQHDEWTVVGPPGTGKTTWLVRQARAAMEAHVARADEFGDAPGCGVLVSSLTRAAAREVLDPKRGATDIDGRQVSTLHAHAYRALGCPELALKARHVAAWNEAEPRFRVSSFGGERGDDLGGDSGGRTDGDDLLAQYHLALARLRDRSAWPPLLQEFATAYERWKFELDLSDFSDIIERAYLTVDAAPGDPRIIFVDEAQDHDRSELRLVRKWARHADRLIIIGDPDQAIYQWRGADPVAFYGDGIPDDHRRVLSQSYRVPRAVHTAAVAMVERIAGRRPVAYQPRDADGAVSESCSFTSAAAGDVLDDAQRFIDAGRSVMFLATCQYMLRPLVAELRERGIPYWNPFAPRNGGFNPLHPSSGRPIIERLLSYLAVRQDLFGERARLWTAGDLLDWLELCGSTGLLKRGATKRIEAWDRGYTPTPQELRGVFATEEVLATIAQGEPATLLGHARPDRRRSLEFAIAVYRAAGLGGLVNEPRVIVGTVHSVKGGEADVVYVSPDLSPGGYDLYDGTPDEHAQVIRLMYVAMTRARERLVICEPSTKRSVEW